MRRPELARAANSMVSAGARRLCPSQPARVRDAIERAVVDHAARDAVTGGAKRTTGREWTRPTWDVRTNQLHRVRAADDASSMLACVDDERDLISARRRFLSRPGDFA
jgi:hypothetical protein